MEQAGLSPAQAQIIVESFTVIAADEDLHTKALTSTIQALGSQPVTGCSFNFEAAFQSAQGGWKVFLSFFLLFLTSSWLHMCY